MKRPKKLAALFLDEIVEAKSALNLPLRIFNTKIEEVRKEDFHGKLETEAWKASNKKEENILRGKLSNNLESRSLFAMFFPTNNTFLLVFDSLNATIFLCTLHLNTIKLSEKN